MSALAWLLPPFASAPDAAVAGVVSAAVPADVSGRELEPLLRRAAEGGAEAGLTAQGTDALAEQIVADLRLRAAERFIVENADTLVAHERLLSAQLARLRADEGPRAAAPGPASAPVQRTDWPRLVRLSVALTCGVVVAGHALRATDAMAGSLGWLMLATGALGAAALAPERESFRRGGRAVWAWWTAARYQRQVRRAEARLGEVQARQVVQRDRLAQREEWLALASALVLAELHVQHGRGVHARTMASNVEEGIS